MGAGLSRKDEQMLRTDQKINRLEQVPMLRACTPSDLRSIAATGDMIAVEPGDVVRHRNDDSFVLILDGEAISSDGSVLSSGDGCGAEAILTEQREADEVWMLTDGRVLIMSGRQFRSLMRRCSVFATAVARSLATRSLARSSSR
jgi:CRP-like cAMP-binding protein